MLLVSMYVLFVMRSLIIYLLSYHWERLLADILLGESKIPLTDLDVEDDKPQTFTLDATKIPPIAVSMSISIEKYIPPTDASRRVKETGENAQSVEVSRSPML